MQQSTVEKTQIRSLISFSKVRLWARLDASQLGKIIFAKDRNPSAVLNLHQVRKVLRFGDRSISLGMSIEIKSIVNTMLQVKMH